MQETEADTRANRIDPSFAMWAGGVVAGSRVAREEIAKDRITTAGRINPLKADYVLSLNGRKLAVIEAKRAGLGYTEGLARAKASLQRPALLDSEQANK